MSEFQHLLLEIILVLVAIIIGAAAWWQPTLRLPIPTLHQVEKTAEALVTLWALWQGFHEGRWDKAQFGVTLAAVLDLDDWRRPRVKKH